MLEEMKNNNHEASTSQISAETARIGTYGPLIETGRGYRCSLAFRDLAKGPSWTSTDV